MGGVEFDRFHLVFPFFRSFPVSGDGEKIPRFLRLGLIFLLRWSRKNLAGGGKVLADDD